MDSFGLIKLILIDVAVTNDCFNMCNPFSQAGNMGRAEELVREMEENGIDAPIDAYHSMMHGYTNIQNEEKCLIVFERLKVCLLVTLFIV